MLVRLGERTGAILGAALLAFVISVTALAFILDLVHRYW